MPYLDQVSGSPVAVNPFGGLAGVVLLAGLHELVFEVHGVRVQRAHPHGLEELHARLQEASVDHGPVALRVDERQHRAGHVPFHLV